MMIIDLLVRSPRIFLFLLVDKGRVEGNTGGGEILTQTRCIGEMGYQRRGKWIRDESEPVKL